MTTRDLKNVSCLIRSQNYSNLARIFLNFEKGSSLEKIESKHTNLPTYFFLLGSIEYDK